MQGCTTACGGGPPAGAPPYISTFFVRRPSITITVPPPAATEEEEVKVHYLGGVRQRPWGKFVVEIRDPVKKGSRLWLGTYGMASAVPRAYDLTAFRMCRHKAILNFSLEAGRAVTHLPAKNCRIRRREGSPVPEKKVVIKTETTTVTAVKTEMELVTEFAMMPLKPSCWTGLDLSGGIFNFPPL